MMIGLSWWGLQLEFGEWSSVSFASEPQSTDTPFRILLWYFPCLWAVSFHAWVDQEAAQDPSLEPWSLSLVHCPRNSRCLSLPKHEPCLLNPARFRGSLWFHLPELWSGNCLSGSKLMLSSVWERLFHILCLFFYSFRHEGKSSPCSWPETEKSSERNRSSLFSVDA